MERHREISRGTGGKGLGQRVAGVLPDAGGVVVADGVGHRLAVDHDDTIGAAIDAAVVFKNVRRDTFLPICLLS